MKDFEISKFNCQIKALKENEYEKFGVSQGSIDEAVKSLLPSDFDPSENIDVLPVVFNLAVVNEFNKNGDGIDTATAMDAVKRFINKPINVEHKKHKIVGHMINASFSDKEFDFKDNDIESYASKTEPFYITAAGLIYKNIFPELATAIEEAAEENSDQYQSISTSWELAFKNYKIVYGSNRLDECTVAEGQNAEKLQQYIRGFGGKGVDSDGTPVHRLICGKTYPLGAALTYNPAARVKGVYTGNQQSDMMNEDSSDANENDLQNKEQKISPTNEKNVKKEKFNIFNMDTEQFEQLMTKVAESVASVVKKDDQASSIGEIMRDALAEHSETWKSKVQAESDARVQAQLDLTELKASFEAIQSELNTLKTEVEAQAAVELFNSRMNFVDATYDLSEDELKFVVAELKSVETSEESFEGFKNKISVIFAHKSKEAIAQREIEIQNKIDALVAAKLQESTASEKDGDDENESETELEIESEAKASILNNNGQDSEKISLVERLKNNFSVEVKH